MPGVDLAVAFLTHPDPLDEANLAALVEYLERAKREAERLMGSS